MRDGYKIVLTAERCLMSNYNNALFLGFTACGPKNLFNPFLYFRLVCPPVPTYNGGIAKNAPYGLRKIEAALLDYGFDENDVVVVVPDKIRKFVGPNTKIIGISSNDPLGKGPASTTFTGPLGLVRGESYIAWKFRELVTDPYLRKWGAKIVVGGPGAWQLEDPEPRRELGIDVVVSGEGENVVPPLFEKIIRGEDVPEVVYGDVVEVDKMSLIRNPTICSLVEVARGCGRGCKFCLPTLRRLRSRPLEHILKEVEVNLRDGRRWITLHAEDILRYKAHGIKVNRQAVVELWESIMKMDGVIGVGPSHFALSSVASEPTLLEELSTIVGVGTKDKPWIAGQTGIESGSPRIMSIHMRGKVLPFKPDEWPDVVEQAFGICKDSNWVPCATLIMGLPGETEDDVIKTIELLDRLKDYKSLIVPLFFVPLGVLKNERGFGVQDMNEYHWELMLACWDHDIRWLVELAREYLHRMRWIARAFIMRFVNFVVKKANKRVRKIIHERMEEASKSKTYLKIEEGVLSGWKSINR